MEEGVRESDPVGRGRYTPGGRGGGHQRGLVPRLAKLPWIPSEQQWLSVLEVARREPVRNRVMLALAYDAALRRSKVVRGIALEAGVERFSTHTTRHLC